MKIVAEQEAEYFRRFRKNLAFREHLAD